MPVAIGFVFSWILAPVVLLNSKAVLFYTASLNRSRLSALIGAFLI